MCAHGVSAVDMGHRCQSTGVTEQLQLSEVATRWQPDSSVSHCEAFESPGSWPIQRSGRQQAPNEWSAGKRALISVTTLFLPQPHKTDHPSDELLTLDMFRIPFWGTYPLLVIQNYKRIIAIYVFLYTVLKSKIQSSTFEYLIGFIK